MIAVDTVPVHRRQTPIDVSPFCIPDRVIDAIDAGGIEIVANCTGAEPTV